MLRAVARGIREGHGVHVVFTKQCQHAGCTAHAPNELVVSRGKAN